MAAGEALMEIQLDRDFILSALERLVNTPSPVGYGDECLPLLESYGRELKASMWVDQRQTTYFALDGRDNSKTVCLAAHLDTLGLAVAHINDDGSLRVRQLGGNNLCSLEHEKVYVITRDGGKYTGYVCSVYHSVHVFPECISAPRTIDTMAVLLDEEVTTADGARNLGIRPGDPIAVEPRFELLPNGRIRSRYLDDKAGIAALLGAYKYLAEHCLRPYYRTIFAFPLYEEVGHGGSYLPQEVSEYIAVDVGVSGPSLDGTERDVAIVAQDRSGPYDRRLTTLLVRLAEELQIPFVTAVYDGYSTDAMGAFNAGNPVSVAAFGMIEYASHGVERTFDSAILNTCRLAVAYALRER